MNDFLKILKDKFNIRLNNQQQKAVEHKDGPAIVLAVPGAGKTTVLICRTANLILNHNISPSKILSITFSKASARDMKKRFTDVFGDVVKDNITFSTIHSFAFHVIREYAYHKKIKYKLIEGSESEFNKIRILKGLYHRINGAYINDDKLEELQNTIGYLKNTMIDIEDTHKYTIPQIRNFKEICRQYEDFKRSKNLIDFDDMLTLTFQILQSNPSLLAKYRNTYQYIQVDEGQDTSKIQNQIISLLAHPNNNLFIVADDDQSIYGFRGASPEDLLNFENKYANAEKFYMEENYRSTKNIVDVSNTFIKRNTARFDKNLLTCNKPKRPVTIVKVNNEFEQYRYIIKELQTFKDYRDTAILFRNNISSIALAEYLNRHSIPFYIRDSKLGFFNHWVVNDIISFLKLSIDTYDISSFENIYYKMKGYISKEALKYVKTQKVSKDVFSSLLSFPGFKQFQLRNISGLQKDFKALRKKKPLSAINFIEKELEYGKYLKDRGKNSGYSYEGTKMVLSILKSISIETNSTMEFLSRLDELQRLIQESKDNRYKNAVTLTTIHSSKGLEFKRVYMVDLIDGEFPTMSSIDSYDMGQPLPLEEERRLFYVGMTRSKEVLDLIAIKEKNNERIYHSRFINELEYIMHDVDSVNNPIGDILKVGKQVVHKKFGKGKIQAIQDDTIVIDFKSLGVKQLSLHMCIEKRLLEANNN